ncbi:hypothetical protein [Erysipelothrix aquatica]|uniref:hypothetical protein n=1 Tax=Erysipelothrix aquatica TaxID=2683714 RepID=UPI0013574B9A|nr:hypothetical protein [Erysipelothrix aquatica]
MSGQIQYLLQSKHKWRKIVIIVLVINVLHLVPLFFKQEKSLIDYYTSAGEWLILYGIYMTPPSDDFYAVMPLSLCDRFLGTVVFSAVIAFIMTSLIALPWIYFGFTYYFNFFNQLFIFFGYFFLSMCLYRTPVKKNDTLGKILEGTFAIVAIIVITMYLFNMKTMNLQMTRNYVIGTLALIAGVYMQWKENRYQVWNKGGTKYE